MQARPPCCQRSPFPELALLFCCLPGGRRERRAARGLAAVPVPPVSAPLAGGAVQLLPGTQDPGLQGSSNVLLSAGAGGWGSL